MTTDESELRLITISFIVMLTCFLTLIVFGIVIILKTRKRTRDQRRINQRSHCDPW